MLKRIDVEVPTRTSGEEPHLFGARSSWYIFEIQSSLHPRFLKGTSG